MGMCTSSQAERYHIHALKLVENAIYLNDSGLLDVLLRQRILSREELDASGVLHLAAGQGAWECVSLLLHIGLRANALAETTGQTPLHSAVVAEEGAAKCIRELLRYGANVNHCGDVRCRRTPLLTAIAAHQADAVDVLAADGADLDGPSLCSRGISPLLLAIELQDVDIVRVLLQRGASLHRCRLWRNKTQTPLDTVTYTMLTCKRYKDSLAQIFNLLVQGDSDLTLTLSRLPHGQRTKFRDIRLFQAINTVFRRINKYYSKDAQRFLSMVLNNGFRPRGMVLKYIKEYDTDHDLYEAIWKHICTPSSLKKLCVKCVRSCLKVNVHYAIDNITCDDNLSDLILMINQ